MKSSTLVRGVALLALGVLLLGATAGSGGVDIVDAGDLYQSIATSTTISLTAFVLQPDGAMVDALDIACLRGAHVAVELDRPGFAAIRSTNDAAIAKLRGARCQAGYADHALHMKVALLGNVAYLSDKNFAADGLLLRDVRPDDRGVIAAALRGEPQDPSDRFWVRKADAVDGEAQLMGSAHRTLFVESESFGAGTPVYDILLAAARSGIHAFLLVAVSEFSQTPSEQAAVGALVRSGVIVRLSTQNAKLAVVDSAAAWVGSANATDSVPDQQDWGMILPTAADASVVRNRFASDWNASTPLK